MRNACIILRKSKYLFSDSGNYALMDAFISAGYAFDELRAYSISDIDKIKNGFLQLRAEHENIMLCCDKAELPAMKDVLSNIFDGGVLQSSYNGADIFDDKKTSVFLLSADESDTGTQYAKEVCIPYLKQKSNTKTDSFVIRCMGANDSHIEQLILRAKQRSGTYITFERLRKYGEDVIRIIYDMNVSKILIDEIVRLFVDGLGECIYALEDISLQEQLVRLLKLRNCKISVAESFTGGGIGRRIVSVSGASAVYFEGLNTYNEDSKRKRLGVSEYSLKTVGVVSDQTAYEMAAGLLGTGDCNISIATTGLAGPKSDHSLLPVGLCYIAIGTPEKVFVYRYKFDGTRNEITETAINYALFLAYKQLKDI